MKQDRGGDGNRRGHQPDDDQEVDTAHAHSLFALRTKRARVVGLRCVMAPDDFSHLPEHVSKERGRFWATWPAVVVVAVTALAVVAIAASAYWLFVVLASGVD